MSGTSMSKSLYPGTSCLPAAEDSADPSDGPAQEFGLGDVNLKKANPVG